MSETLPAFRVRLAREALTAYVDEYKAWDERWKNLEAKAQASIAIAGVFTGGAIGIITDMDTSTPGWQKFLAWIVVSALFGVVLLIADALRIRLILSPPSGTTVEELVNDLLNGTQSTVQATEMMEREERLLRDQMRLWREANNKLAKVSEEKAARIAVAQWLLVGSVAAILPLMVTTLVSS